MMRSLHAKKMDQDLGHYKEDHRIPWEYKQTLRWLRDSCLDVGCSGIQLLQVDALLVGNGCAEGKASTPVTMMGCP